MKIAMVVPESGPCGIGDYTRRLVELMPEQVDLICTQVANANSHDILHVQYEPVLFRKKRKSLFPTLMRWNHNLKKVVTVHEAYHVNPFIAERPVEKGLIGFLKRIKYDFRHSLELYEESFAKRDFYSDAVIVHTRNAKAVLMRKGCHQEKIHVIPHPVFSHPPARKAPRGWKKIPEDKKILLLFGFISPAVDYETILKALKCVQDRCFLVIAGSTRRPEDRGLEDALVKKIQDEGVENSVHLTGYVEEECLSFLFSRSDIFISAPRFKTASGSLSHALGECIPVVAPDMQHVREINAEINCINTYEPGNFKELSKKIEELLDPSIYAEFVNRLKVYSGNHSITSFIENQTVIYRRVLESSN